MITDEFQYAYDLYAQIKQHKDAILRDMKNGNVTAKTIVSTHDMMVRHPDPCAFAILEMSFEKWLKGEDSHE